MSWNQIIIDVPDELKDSILGELSESGMSGVWESGEPAPGETRLVVYFKGSEVGADIEERIKSIFARVERQMPTMMRNAVAEQDWTEEWKKSYSSFPIGNNFFVIPSWCVTDVCPEDRFAIHIDPGQAFGTGTHETTQLTVEMLERWVEPAHLVLDLGTGSGILAIAARLLGARDVFACDIDEVAVRVAGANMTRNSEPDRSTFCGSIDAIQADSVQLLLCNLTADVIIHLFPEIARVLRPGGNAIFSGILTEQREEVREVIHSFQYSVHEEITRGEWLALVAGKNVA